MHYKLIRKGFRLVISCDAETRYLYDNNPLNMLRHNERELNTRYLKCPGLGKLVNKFSPPTEIENLVTPELVHQPISEHDTSMWQITIM